MKTPTITQLVDSSRQLIGRSEKPEKTNCIDKCQGARKTERVWIELTAIFGRAFESQFGEIDGVAFQLWKNEIEKIEPVCLREGINSVIALTTEKRRSGEKTFAPDLPSFLALCMPKKPRFFEDMYKITKLKLPEYTREEYQAKGKKGMAKIRGDARK